METVTRMDTLKAEHLLIPKKGKSFWSFSLNSVQNLPSLSQELPDGTRTPDCKANLKCFFYFNTGTSEILWVWF